MELSGRVTSVTEVRNPEKLRICPIATEKLKK